MEKTNLADLLVGRRFSPAIRSAIFLVLVDGIGQTEAAKLNNLKRQQVNRAVKNILKSKE
jgi:hypothetical protein